jgi:hypothetical protein
VRRELFPAKPAWRHAFAVAAALLLWVNLSMSVANNTTWPLAAGPDRAGLDETAERIRALAPELSEREARRQALVSQVHPAPAPALPADPARILRHKEQDLWDTD